MSALGTLASTRPAQMISTLTSSVRFQPEARYFFHPLRSECQISRSEESTHTRTSSIETSASPSRSGPTRSTATQKSSWKSRCVTCRTMNLTFGMA